MLAKVGDGVSGYGLRNCAGPAQFIVQTKEEALMMKIAFIAATAVAVLTTAPLTAPAKAQGVDVRIGGGRYDHPHDPPRHDYTVRIGPGGGGGGAPGHCRTQTTQGGKEQGGGGTRPGG